MNYWKVKTNKLIEIVKERGLILDKEDRSNRKFIINLIKIDDMGEDGSVLTLNDEGELVDLSANQELVKPEDDEELFVEDKKEEVAVVTTKTKAVDISDSTKVKYDPSKPYGGIKMMRCIFRHSVDSDQGHVQLGVQGKQFYIPKDKEVVIPKYLTSAIKDALMYKMETITLHDGTIEQRKTPVPRITWEYLGDV